MNISQQKILITCGLPYTNGNLHLGHLVGYIMADIYTRFLKMTGRDAIYICGSDTHGTGIELNARRLGMTPEDMVAKHHREFQEDFAAFNVQFDNYDTTHSETNRQFAEHFFTVLRDRGDIVTRELELAYCESCARFLPDRYVRGTCPKCGAADQYGDVCEVCNATYDPVDVKDAHCALCGAPPVRKTSKQYFFVLSNHAAWLESWVNDPRHLQPETRAFVQTWLREGLRDWDISRDAPYFGFVIPGETDKYLYVWMDAPIGYISSTANWCARHGRNVADYWSADADSYIFHFIGKDIVYFHTLFWPTMLRAANFHVPNRVQVHGMLTVNGEKMSKSRGTSINARTYLRHLDPQYLRFYYASKYSSSPSDLDLNLEDFVLRVNADLVNKLANMVSRVVPFVNSRLGGKLGRVGDDAGPLIQQVNEHIAQAREFYGQLEIGRAVREIVTVAELGNKYLQDAAPWEAIKTNPERAREICTLVANFCKVAAVMIQPVLPEFSARVVSMLGLSAVTWADANMDLHDVTLGQFVRLAERIDTKHIEALIMESAAEQAAGKSAPAPADTAPQPETFVPPPIEPLISIDEFMKVDLRAARVLSAEDVPGAKKLIKLIVDDGSRHRTVFAGMRLTFEPKELIGKMVVLAANLQPRQMKWGVSEGMILAAGEDDRNVKLLQLPQDTQPGSRIH